MNCKLAGREQLAAQGVSDRQVYKEVSGGSQRRGSVASASPVMIDRSRNAAGNHPLSFLLGCGFFVLACALASVSLELISTKDAHLI